MGGKGKRKDGLAIGHTEQRSVATPRSSIKIVSWNVNGLRSVVRSGALAAMVTDVRPDVLCLQEIRCDREVAIRLLTDTYPPDAPPHVYCSDFPGRGGYAGVAIVSTGRLPWKEARTLCEGRAVMVRLQEGLSVACVYAMNSGEGLRRLDERLRDWDPLFRDVVCASADQPLVVAGDLNVARGDVDVFDAAGLRRTAGFTDQERRNFEETLRVRRLVDTFREEHGPRERRYTYWSARSHARMLDRGWRIDYVLVSRSLAYRDADVLSHVDGSDHAPVACTVFVNKGGERGGVGACGGGGRPNDFVREAREAAVGKRTERKEEGRVKGAVLLYLTAVLLRRLREAADGTLRDAEFHVRAYDRVIGAVSDGSLDVTAEGDDLRSQPGVGDKIAAKIEEIRATGRLRDVDERDRREAATVLRITAMYGFGYASAVRLVRQHGVVSLRDLGRCPLTLAQRLGLRYAADLRKRIPRSEMDGHRRFLEGEVGAVGDDMKCELAGSYARGRPYSGDIDVLLIVPPCSSSSSPSPQSSRSVPSPSAEHGIRFLRHLEERGYLVSAPPARASFEKYSGLCRLRRSDPVRRIDVLVTTPERAPFARLYFTGPAEFTIAMRRLARGMGLTLNERGLYFRGGDGKGDEGRVLGVRTERDVFARLGLRYVPATRRYSPPIQ